MKKLREAKENENKRQDREDGLNLKPVYIQIYACNNHTIHVPVETNSLFFTGYNFRYRNPALESPFKPPKQYT